jgi:hypothetical protein
LPQLTLTSQAEAAARIAGKDGIFEAVYMGNFDLVKDHVLADAGCVHKTDSAYVCLFRARAAAAHDFSNRARAAAPFNFSNFCYQGCDRVDLLLNRRTP